MSYELRTKTRRAFKEWELAEIMTFADKVCEFAPEKAREIIWKLTYQPRNVLCQYTFLDASMPWEQVILIRGELINRYQKVKETLGYEEYTSPVEGEGEAIKMLRKLAGGDRVIMYEVLRRTSKCTLDHYLAGRYAYLLTSESTRYNFRAFKEIGFDERESSFLFRYADVIAALLKEKVENE